MRPAALCLFALLLFSLMGRADGPSSSDLQRVFIGQGRVLTVGGADQLSLHAHVEDVLYQPGSLEAAYTGVTTDDGDTVTHFVKLVGLKRGETQTLLSDTGPVRRDQWHRFYEMLGWSGDGRYLMIWHDEPVIDADGSPGRTVPVYESVDVGVVPFKVRRLALPEFSSGGGLSFGFATLSPSGSRLAIPWLSVDASGKRNDNDMFFYDPAKDMLLRRHLPSNSALEGWTDDTHLRLLHIAGDVRSLAAFDIVTGKETPTTQKAAFTPPVARAYPDMRLSTAIVPLPVSGPNPQSRTDGVSLWLSIKGAKPRLSSVCLAILGGSATPKNFLAPDQSSVLWVQNGDLYVSRFAMGDATAREKYDAGEHLTCDEERDIAQDNAKQIGLGLLQYSQDYDEQFPPAENFRDGVSPYIKNDSIFSVADHPFSYAAPAKLDLAAIEFPADTVLGTITLPCATVTLYADGHVKSLPPPSDAPAAP